MITKADLTKKALDAAAKIRRAQLDGASADAIAAMRAQRDATLRRDVFQSYGQAAGEAKKRMEAREAFYAAKSRSAADAREVERRRDRIASMTSDQLDAEIRGASFRPTECSHDDLAMLGAEARRRGLTTADMAGGLLAKPQHELDGEWLTAKADLGYYQAWNERQAGNRDVELTEDGFRYKLDRLSADAEEFVKNHERELFRPIAANEAAFQEGVELMRLGIE